MNDEGRLSGRHSATNHHPGLTLALRDALERVSVVVCELELGETSTAYTVASDLEIDLRAAVDRHERQRCAAPRFAA